MHIDRHELKATKLTFWFDGVCKSFRIVIQTSRSVFAQLCFGRLKQMQIFSNSPFLARLELFGRAYLLSDCEDFPPSVHSQFCFTFRFRCSYHFDWMKIHPCCNIRLHRCRTEKSLTWFARCLHVVCMSELDWTWDLMRLWMVSVVFPIDWVIGSDLGTIVFSLAERNGHDGNRDCVKGEMQCGSCLISSSRCSCRNLFEVSEILSGKQRLSLCDLHTLCLFSRSVSLGECLVTELKIEKGRKKELFGLWTSQKHPDSFWCLCLFKMSSTHKELFKRDRIQPKESADPCCFFLSFSLFFSKTKINL